MEKFDDEKKETVRNIGMNRARETRSSGPYLLLITWCGSEGGGVAPR